MDQQQCSSGTSHLDVSPESLSPPPSSSSAFINLRNYFENPSPTEHRPVANYLAINHSFTNLSTVFEDEEEEEGIDETDDEYQYSGIIIPTITITRADSSSDDSIELPRQLYRQHDNPGGTSSLVPVVSENFAVFIDQLIELLRVSQLLSPLIGSTITQTYAWSPLHDSFIFLVPSSVFWIPVGQMMTKDSVQKKCVTIGLWAQRTNNFSSKTCWLAVPSIVRRIAKSNGGIIWIAVSRQYLRALRIKLNTDGTTPSLEEIAYDYSEFLIARKLLAEIKAGRLDQRWLRLISSPYLEHLVGDFLTIKHGHYQCSYFYSD